MESPKPMTFYIGQSIGKYQIVGISKQLNMILMTEKTIGEQRVRTDFNVAGSSLVDEIKSKSADLINLCEPLKEKDGRLASLAQTTFEEAAMWAVKAATV